MEKMLQLCVLLVIFRLGLLERIKWQKSYWHYNEKPFETVFRRIKPISQQVMEIELFKKCKCPPHNECELKYKIDETALELMKLGGKIDENEEKRLRNENRESPVELYRRFRRNNDELVPDNDCCCPPRSVMMPTIISEKQFNETLNRMKN